MAKTSNGAGVSPAFNSANSTDFYLRDNLASQGGVPALPPFNQCPDIIRVGAPIADPNMLSNIKSWGTRYDAQPAIGTDNYFYVRGMNDGSSTCNQTVQLFAAPAQLIPWPARWVNGQLDTASGGSSSSIEGVAPGAVGVTGTPFFADQVAPLPDGQFYGVVAWASANSGSPVPTADSLADMAVLVASTPGLGINQIATLNPNNGPAAVRVSLSLPTDLPDVATISLVVSGAGQLNGPTVGLIADTFTANRQPIVLAPAVLASNGVLGLQANLQAGYEATLTLQFWPGSQPPQDGSTLLVSAYYNVPLSHQAALAAKGALSARGAQHVAAAVGVGPTATAVLGEFTVLFASS